MLEHWNLDKTGLEKIKNMGDIKIARFYRKFYYNDK